MLTLNLTLTLTPTPTPTRTPTPTPTLTLTLTPTQALTLTQVHALENAVLREQLLFFARSMPPPGAATGKLDRHRSAGSMTRSMPLPPV